MTKRGRGRPRQHWNIPVRLWAMVELKRDRQNGSRLSARRAAHLLFEHMQPFMPLLTESTILEAHKKFERERIAPVDDLLRDYRAKRDAIGWDISPLQLVGIIPLKN